MKHLLNDLTEEEKNSIRAQHTGGMNVVIENFSRLINTKSGDAKPLINEGDSTFQPQDFKLFVNGKENTQIKINKVQPNGSKLELEYHISGKPSEFLKFWYSPVNGEYRGGYVANSLVMDCQNNIIVDKQTKSKLFVEVMNGAKYQYGNYELGPQGHNYLKQFCIQGMASMGNKTSSNVA